MPSGAATVPALRAPFRRRELRVANRIRRTSLPAPVLPSSIYPSRLRPVNPVLHLYSILHGAILDPAGPLHRLQGPPAAPAGSSGSRLGVGLDHIANNDILAWLLIVVLLVAFGLVTACGLGIYRQFRNVTPEAELLETIKREARKAAKKPGPVLPPLPPASTRPAPPPWERDADWWKNQPVD